MPTSPWRTARSIPDLGRFMALWLEGRIPQWPGYGAEFGHEEHDDDVRRLVCPLAVVNRAGLVTTQSQPAGDGPGADGARWRQRAFVSGVVRARSTLLARLPVLEREGLVVVVGRPPRPVVLTDRDGRPTLVLDTRRPGRDQLAREWAGTGRRALRELRRGTAVHVVDPVWGRNDRLWPALALLA
ncbi:DUF6919 domain-containing protein [Streptomyces sp. NPDC012421]|uniref:DUF6919 domain-containing protein n=1 Tax=Streptomyces sp. NPDC012421 TaxID=3364832 RepID=UPI0036E9F87D